LDSYCTNFECPHNLFWDELGLDREKIRMTDKALEIRNCCCLIKRPWTPEEIAEAWGLGRESIMDSETAAWRKLKRVISRRPPKKAMSICKRRGELHFLSLTMEDPSGRDETRFGSL
jgi:hypothetical protein